MRLCLPRVLVLLALFTLTGALAAGEGDCATVIDLLQKSYGRPTVFSAKFRHTLKALTLNQTEVEEGTLTLAPGGKTRWQYTTPKGKLAVSDGEKFWLYLPSENQVFVQPAKADASAPLALRLLSGKADFAKEFECLSAAREGASWVLKLKLRGEQAGVQETTVRLGEAGGLEKIAYADSLGNEISLEFWDVKLGGPEPDPALFRFQAPKESKVIQAE